MDEPEPVELPIDGVLDLHTFRPADAKDLVPDYLNECRKRDRKPAALQMIVSESVSMPLEVKQAYWAEFGIFLVDSYGQSELGGLVALGYPQVEPAERLSAIGPALPGKEVRIVDENDNEVPIEDPGEVCIRGDFMAAYWGISENTQNALRNGWLYTGDMGKMDAEGYISIIETTTINY